MIKKIEKILSILILVFIIFNSLQPVLAASGSGQWVGGQFASYIYTTDSTSRQYGVLMRTLVNYSTKEKITAFCAEDGVSFQTGTIYSGSYYTPTSESMKRACKIAYFGWYNKYGDYVIDGGISYDAKKDYVFTQQYIWEALGQNYSTFVDSGIQDEYIEFKNNIDSEIDRMKLRPSFNGTTISLKVGKTTTIYDDNYVLSTFSNLDVTTEGIRIVHNEGENFMTFTVTNDCNLENYKISEDMFRDWGMVKRGTEDYDTSIYFEFSDRVQNQLYSMNYNDPVFLSVSLNIESNGNLELSKLNSNGDLIDGAVFNVTGPNDYNRDISVSNGRITIENLPLGTYYIKEKTAPRGYVINNETYSVQVNPNETAKQSIVDEEVTGVFTLTKTNETGTDNLKGVTYRVWNDNGYDETFQTDNNGIIKIENLKLGNYHYQEIKTIDGFVIDSNVYDFTLEYKDQNTKVVYASVNKNNKEATGTFTLIKKNAEGTLNLKGTKYRVWNDNNYDKEFITDANGKIEITNLKLGKYYYQEIQATEGYLLDNNIYTFELKYKDQNTSVVYANATQNNEEVTGTFVLIKKNSNETKNIEGTKYRVWNNSGYDKEFTTNKEGKIEITGLKLGKYNYQEIQASTGYIIDNQIYTFELKYKDQYTDVVYANATRTNQEVTGTFTLVKKNEDKTKTLSNVTYKIWNDDGYEKEFTTNEDGKIVVENLKLGKYYYQEKQTINGYVVDNNVYTFELKYKDQNTKVVYVNEERTNKETKGTFTLTKKNENKSANIEKTLYRIWSEQNNYDKTFETDKNGKIVVENLKLGKYYYQEIKASDGYLIDNNVYTFELKYKDQNTSVVYVNEEKTNKEPTGSILITKKDSKTGSVAQGNAQLINATYQVFALEDIYNKAKTQKFYSKGDLVATRNTNIEGICEKVENLPLGRYLVKETVCPVGYLLDTTEYEVDLKYKDENTEVISKSIISNENVKNMQVHIFKSGIKVNSGLVNGIEGAEFNIKLFSDVEKAYNQGYSYEEVWNGIDEYGNKVEVDKDRVAKAQVIAPTYEVIKTDSDGNAYTTKNLPYGKYIVKETYTPEDFESAEDFTFSITQDESEVNDIAQKVKHLVVNNEQLETYIKIIKEDLKTEKIVTFNSATFEIRATKDIYDRGTGKIIYKKGEVITQKVGSVVFSKFTTNADNIIVPDNSYNSNNDEKGTITTPLLLPVGSYEISEVETPKGFLQLNDPVKFTVKAIRNYDTDEGGDYVLTIKVKNEQPTGTLILNKIINVREDIDTSLVDVSDLSKIQFELIAKEDIINAIDGSIIYKKGTKINTYNLDKNGKLKITNLPLGVYTIKEVKTLPGLILNPKEYEVKFTQKDLETKVYEINQDITNDTTLFEFSKTDVTGQKELPGANLTVLDQNGKILDNWVSTDKTHKIEGLIVGQTYTLQEKVAPDGYVVAKDIKFKVENTKEVQKVEMIDKIVEMSKNDIAGNEIEGAKLKVIDKSENVIDSWTSTKEPHKIKGLIEGQTYTLVEDYAPNGYVISNSIEFTVTDDKKTQKVEMIDKIVEMSKVDVSGNELEGATIQVIDKNGKVIDEWVSTKEAHKINNLVEGEKYILHEEIAIDGYVKASDIEFEVGYDKETQKIEMIDKIVSVKKTDFITGEELPGAELTITDEEGNIIDSWTSTSEEHYVIGLEENKTYILTETTCPYGYEQAESIKFTVSEEKENQLIEMKDAPILKTIKVIKVDEDTQEIIKGDFIFGIYEDSECTKLINEVKSDKESGIVTFENLRYGTYYIKEIKAPNNYQLSDKVIKIDINDKGTFSNDELLEENNSICTFNYYNKQIPKIQTGNEINYILLIACIVISLIGIAVSSIIIVRKKKINN